MRKKLRGGGYAGEDKEDKMRGGGALRKKNIEGGMPERVKKTKCGGWGWETNVRGYAGERKEDEMRGGGGGCGKN